MAGIVHYTYCPVCNSGEIKFVLTAKDHTVTGENFSIYECGSCSLRFTQDVPDTESVAAYYRSEDYISHSDSSKGLINKLYKKVRQRTIKNKRRLIVKETGLDRGNILDVGSGTGNFLREMRSHGWAVTGIEPDKGARLVAKNIHDLELSDEKALFDLPSGNFDVITLWHVLEHVHDLHGYLKQLRSLLRDGGTIIIAVPNYTAHDARVYEESWAAYDVPRHLYHFSPLSIKILVEKHDMVIKKYVVR
jgi:2-polyprenyl-3-methyl-5-hydroxy-6-metoxy-1,4-benzoquinol methylase